MLILLDDVKWTKLKHLMKVLSMRAGDSLIKRIINANKLKNMFNSKKVFSNCCS